MSLIVPTVGRKVWYRPSAADKAGNFGMKTTGDQPLDATVLAAWGPRCINVQVLDIEGRPFTRTSVTLIQEGDTPAQDGNGNTVGGYCEWMPYQQGQAKKAE